MATGRKSNIGKGKQTKAIHQRFNGWKLGDYDSFNRDGEIVVGQLCYIDMESGIGWFRGYVLNDQAGQKREGQFREWSHYLSVDGSPTPTAWIARYEHHIRSLEGNS